MSDVISFWLDNKTVSARTVAVIGDQTLVDYRGRFHVVRNGSALMKGSKPLQYSKSSLPTIWKKALRGEKPTIPDTGDDEILPLASVTKRIRPKKEKEAPMPEAAPQPDAPQPPSTKPAARPAKKIEARPPAQSAVPAQCPYCGQKHELPVEKGRNGKPFFVTCTRCTVDFAVRFVPVTMFQAQVAGFK